MMQDLNDIEYAVERLRSDGVFVLPGYFGSMREELFREHVSFTSSDQSAHFHRCEMPGERIFATTSERLLQCGFEKLGKALGAEWFPQISQLYFRNDASMSPGLVSLAHDTWKPDPNCAGNHHAHWDPTLTLRMMIYVTDVTKVNGALEVKRGTHYRNHERRIHDWKEGAPYSERPICAGEEQVFEAIEASAGSVLVFDTSITHRRGLVAMNEERRVCFAHIHSPLAERQLSGDPFEDVDESLLWKHR